MKSQHSGWMTGLVMGLALVAYARRRPQTRHPR